MGIRLKSSTTGTKRIRRSVEDKARVLALIAGGASLKDAFVEVFGDTVSASMTNNRAPSIKASFEASVNKAIEAGNEDVIAILRDADLIEDDGESSDTIED